MNVPEKHDLQNDSHKDHQEDGENNGLVVEDSNSFVCSADRGEPVELTHREGQGMYGEDEVAVVVAVVVVLG